MPDLEDRLRELEGLVRKQIGRIAELEARQDRMIRHGQVTDVDHEKHEARIEIGEKDGKPVLSAWRPYAQVAGPDGEGENTGEFKFHNPPAIGQQMTMVSPNGELRQGLILPFTWHEKAVSPSTQGDEHVVTFGKLKITHKKERYTVSLGADVSLDMTPSEIALKATKITMQGGDGMKWELTAGEQKYTGGKITHDGKLIDKGHKHGGVMTGQNHTDVPDDA